jgi:hypothetical protein
MTVRTEEVLRSAMALSQQERADIVSQLLATLDDTQDDPAEVEASWASELQRRDDEDDGEDVSWEDVQAEAYTLLRRE